MTKRPNRKAVPRLQDPDARHILFPGDPVSNWDEVTYERWCRLAQVAVSCGLTEADKVKALRHLFRKYPGYALRMPLPTEVELWLADHKAAVKELGP